MRKTPIILLLAATALLTACGTSGGTATATANGAPVPVSTLGTRSVPGYDVAVAQPSGSAAGTFQVTVTPGAGQPAVTGVCVWLGTADYEPAAIGTPAQPMAGQPGAFDVSMNLPATLPTGTTVWVRLTKADGATIEVGRDAFPLTAQ
jgi:hypothetical protein